MTIDKPQHGSLASEVAVVSGGAIDKASKLFSFKKALALSTKDYVVICCLAVLLLGGVVAITYIKPLEYFHVLSREKLMAMVQENLHKTPLEFFKDLILPSFSSSGMAIQELWHAAGWNGVWAFICFIPQEIFGITTTLFPVILVFHFLLDRELKEMIQQ
ncbi:MULTISPECIES: hypothetical protein [unclassified Bartonella]|uniref:hypothetical protein n=1 Tax=unclassified Bartonella TaxID=2645622 RepID=UPI002360885C|nr:MULTISPECIES: hypothetical protein [unclassified Bartonella]